MTLKPGTRIGRFEIVSPLGAGGMGEVYRAKDTNLGREVAIKTLPPELSAHKDRLARFEQEARAASALNHPNIVTIYEFGRDDSTHYIAMEIVEGETLRHLCASGPVPMRQVIQIAAQILEGLAKAHEAGITHRDLKPDNVIISRDGFAKILDFGLAKVAITESQDPLVTRSATGPTTLPGELVGTVSYMSPEQANGEPVDFRADQFSFGTVLYEMVTGKHAFRKAGVAETLMAIIKEEPVPVLSLNPQAPAPLCWIVERCLSKQPEHRYASTRDLSRDLASIRDRFSEMPFKRPQVRPSNLPAQRTAFVGHESELAAAKELLLRPDARLITVTGPGGIGKTRLALEVVGQVMDHFSGGVYFIPLAALRDPGLITSVIAQTLGVRESGGQSVLDALKESLRSAFCAPTLLLLDNFEHLISAGSLVAELLGAAPAVKFLVTSRAALHVYGEHEFPVPPLALPESKTAVPVSALSSYSAMALFASRAAAVKPGFEVTDENSSGIIEICTRLDGVPLAIELAAARVKFLTPSAIRTRLANRLQLLTGGARDLPERQQTLRGTIDWSYDLLSPEEQKLFNRLAVFTGGCTLEGVEAVCDTKGDLGIDLLDGLASLVDKSLIQQVQFAEGESRFAMLDMIREYALEKLAASGEESPTRRAHAAYFLVLAEEDAAATADAERTEWLRSMDMEHDNLRAALEWLTETSSAEWALRLGVSMFRYWEQREYLAEGRERLGKILKLDQAAARNNLRSRALFAAGVLAVGQGDYASSVPLLEESVAISTELGDKRGVAVSLNALAVQARDRGDSAASYSLFGRSLAIWRESNDPLAVARGLSNMANVVKLQGDFARARSLYEEALAIFQKLGDRTGAAWTHNYMGDAAHGQSDVAAAQTLYEQALAAFRELGDRWGVASSLGDLGNLARDQKNYPLAHSRYCESMKVFQELGHKRGIARVLEGLAYSAAVESQPERALRLAGAAAVLRQSIGAPLTSAEHERLEKSLEVARQSLAGTAASAAWMDGWVMPLDKAIAEALQARPA
jgi:predicted ATPase